MLKISTGSALDMNHPNGVDFETWIESTAMKGYIKNCSTTTELYQHICGNLSGMASIDDEDSCRIWRIRFKCEELKEPNKRVA